MSLRQSIGEMAGTLLSVACTRLELFSLEASAQKSRLVKVLGMAFAAFLFLALALLVFSIAIALYFWPTEQRYLALALLALIYGLLGVGFLWAVRRALLFEPMPFSATLHELQRDVAMVQRLGPRTDPAGGGHPERGEP